jgi:hypothetical protein
MIRIPPELGRQIQQRIDALDAADWRSFPLRVCKETMNALPLHGDPVYLWALRPDGVVLCLDHESFSLPFEPEADPLKLYAVLLKGAEAYPELRALVPERPAGAQPCEACGGTGSAEGSPPPTWGCLRCMGLGWYARSRPAADWLNRIDRGDRLELRADASGRQLVAGRIAGRYVSADGEAYWSSPATPAARQELIERLMAWERGEPVTPAWQPNPATTHDPFDSLEHAFRFSGTGSGGSWEDELARQPDGTYRLSETLNNDFDPAGPPSPVTRTRELDADAARAELERRMRGGGRPSPFPAIVPRDRDG